MDTSSDRRACRGQDGAQRRSRCAPRVLSFLLILLPAVATASGPHIYWTTTSNRFELEGKIQRAYVDGSSIQTLRSRIAKLWGIALDIPQGKMYWVNHELDEIRRANLDGSGATVLVDSGLSWPFAIALDLTARKMYWTDIGPSAARIKRANLDGSDIEYLINQPGGLWGVAIDSDVGKLYWANAGDNKIQRANLEIPDGETMDDRTDIEDLITGLGGLREIALDVTAGKMYWIRDDPGVIERASLDGSDVELLIDGLDVPLDIAVDPGAGKMYWVEELPWVGWNHIWRANLDGSEPEHLLGARKLVQIALDPSCVTVGSDCQHNGIPDDCELIRGMSVDCDGDSIPDECEDPSADCNANGVPDVCDVSGGPVLIDVDFESGLPPGWTTTGVFQVTDECAVYPVCDGSMWAYAGSTASCTYSSEWHGELISPTISLGPGKSELRYCTIADIDVWESTAIVLVNDDVVVSETTTDGVWEQRVIDLTGYRDESIEITFSFWAGWAMDTPLGWQVDAIHVSSGSADSNSNGVPDECEIPPIPTATGWGAAIFTALLLVAATLVIKSTCPHSREPCAARDI